MVFAAGYCIARWQATCANSKADRSGVGNVKCRAAFGSTARKTLAVPRRSYSLSRRASRPGLAAEAGRTSAAAARLQEPVTVFNAVKNWRFRSVLIPQFTGGHW